MCEFASKYNCCSNEHFAFNQVIPNNKNISKNEEWSKVTEGCLLNIYGEKNPSISFVKDLAIPIEGLHMFHRTTPSHHYYSVFICCEGPVCSVSTPFHGYTPSSASGWGSLRVPAVFEDVALI